MPITFKQLRTLEDLAPCERLQEAVWKFNKADIIPSRFMRILCKHGGFAMGAFDGDLMIGFSIWSCSNSLWAAFTTFTYDGSTARIS